MVDLCPHPSAKALSSVTSAASAIVMPPSGLPIAARTRDLQRVVVKHNRRIIRCLRDRACIRRRVVRHHRGNASGAAQRPKTKETAAVRQQKNTFSWS